MADPAQGPSEKMSEARRRFQLRLSTIIVLTVAAGGLLGLNIRHQYPKPREPVGAVLVPGMFPAISGRPNVEITYLVFSQGWPFIFRLGMDENLFGISSSDEWHSGLLIANVGIALGILGTIAVCCESRIRRRVKNE
jgi:hypothetical protein